MLDSLYRGHRAAVPAGAEFVQVDLLDADAVNARGRAGFDGVVHFAALSLVAESVEFPERYYRGNVVGALNLLDAMRASGVKRIVFSSTAATYGEPDVDLITEDAAEQAGQHVRELEARGRSHARRRGPRARPGGGLAALLQRRGRERRRWARTTPRDPPDPARPAGRGRQARERRDLRHRLPDAGRDRGARLHPRRGPRARAHPRARARAAGAPRHLQPRQRDAAPRPRGDRDRPPGHRASTSSPARSRAARAIRRSSSPPTSALAPAWAGRRRRRSRT